MNKEVIKLEATHDHSQNVRILSPTILRRFSNAYPDYKLRLLSGDTYGIRTPDKTIGVDIFAVKRGTNVWKENS